MLFVMLSQEVHNIMPILPSEETLLMSVRKCDSSTSKSARKPEKPSGRLEPNYSTIEY